MDCSLLLIKGPIALSVSEVSLPASHHSFDIVNDHNRPTLIQNYIHMKKVLKTELATYMTLFRIGKQMCRSGVRNPGRDISFPIFTRKEIETKRIRKEI